MIHKCSENRGPYIVTYPSRSKVFFLRPSVEMFMIDDIAHALSLQTRFLGHISRPYSVAQHSVLVAQEVLGLTGSKVAALCALMHDSEEAYTGDLPRPMKHDSTLAGFRSIADRLKFTILKRFALAQNYREWEPVIKEVDSQLLHTESVQLSHGATWEDPSKVLDIEIDKHADRPLIDVLESALRCDSDSAMRYRIDIALRYLQEGGYAGRWRREFLSRFRSWS